MRSFAATVLWAIVCCSVVSSPAVDAFGASGEAAVQGRNPGDQRDAARALFAEGRQAHQQRDYRAAEAKFMSAFERFPASTIGLWWARSLAAQNLMVEAKQRYETVQSLPLPSGLTPEQRALQDRARLEAKGELDELLLHFPEVHILADFPLTDVTLLVDGSAVVPNRLGAILVNPGPRLIQARRGAALSSSVRIVAGRDAKEAVRISFVMPSTETGEIEPNASRGQRSLGKASDSKVTRAGGFWRTAGWVGVGIGGSALLASGVMGLAAAARLDDFDCEGGAPCRSGDADALRGYNRLRTWSTVGYIAGGVLAGTGVYLLLGGEDEGASEPASIALRVGPGSALLQGSF